jgi:hypothetical protein
MKAPSTIMHIEDGHGNTVEFNVVHDDATGKFKVESVKP